MEKRIFRTYIVGGHKLNKPYVRGKISGIAFVMSEGHRSNDAAYAYSHDKKSDSWIHTMKCTIEQYIDFCDIIKELYPGLCQFDTCAMAKSIKDEEL